MISLARCHCVALHRHDCPWWAVATRLDRVAFRARQRVLRRAQASAEIGVVLVEEARSRARITEALWTVVDSPAAVRAFLGFADQAAEWGRIRTRMFESFARDYRLWQRRRERVSLTSPPEVPLSSPPEVAL